MPPNKRGKTNKRPRRYDPIELESAQQPSIDHVESAHQPSIDHSNGTESSSNLKISLLYRIINTITRFWRSIGKNLNIFQETTNKFADRSDDYPPFRLPSFEETVTNSMMSKKKKRTVK